MNPLENLRVAAWEIGFDFVSGFVGYVLRFQVPKEFSDAHPPREAVGRDLVEHWVPAEEVSGFNAAIVGLIEIVERHKADLD